MSIEAIKEALKAGPTEGPWDSFETRVYLNNCGGFDIRNCPQPEQNAAFIAACNPVAIRSLIERLEAAEKDAARYAWLKSQKSLDLRTDGSFWFREDKTRFRSSHFLAAGNTQFGPAETLDTAIDSAMEASK